MLMHRPSSLLQVLLQGRLLRCTVQCQQSLPRLPGPRGEALVALPRCLLNTASESTHHAPPAPFRKQLKDAAKKQKVTEGVPEFFRSSNAPDTRRDKWELTVGIEIHAQLHTEHKLFSRMCDRSKPGACTLTVFQVQQSRSMMSQTPTSPSLTQLFQERNQ